MALLFQKIASGASKNPMRDLSFMRRESGLKANSKSTRDWFRKKAAEVASVNPKALLDKTGRKTTRLQKEDVGRMFMYFYDPKNKETLPYYDRFPVIFVIDVYNDGSFLGLNLHYLPTLYRAKLMDALYQTINNDRYDKTTRLRLTYQLLSSATKFRFFKPCLKKYLYNHLRSNMVEIQINDWDYVALLPLERFQKAKAQQVQSDSIQQFRRGGI
jgi:hypothetical protein